MQNFKKYKIIYIIAALLVLLSIGSSFLFYGISVWANYTKFPYYISLLVFIFLYGLLAYLSGDILIIKYRKEVNEFNPEIPEGLKEKIFRTRLPFIIALVVTLAFTAVLFIIFLFTGRWPLL